MKIKTQSKIDWALGVCRENRFRKTRALEEILQLLAASAKPISWSTLKEKKALGSTCDPATIFRLLTKLEKIGVVRKLGLHSRSIHYFLNVPGDDHHDYLICSECGDIRSLDIHCPVSRLEKDIEKISGFKNLYHELEFYGLCPKCA